jgi:hypothetical protein
MGAKGRHETHEAEPVCDRAMAETEAARQAAASTEVQLETLRAQLAECQDSLAVER